MAAFQVTPEENPQRHRAPNRWMRVAGVCFRNIKDAANVDTRKGLARFIVAGINRTPL